MKAARTREHLVDVAVELFIAQGYDQTTMEQIAATAEVAPATLYRYFPSKDLLILDRLVAFTDLGGALRSRPAEEPVSKSLAIVLREALEAIVVDARGAELRRVIDESPAPRARLWDIAVEVRLGIEQALAERMELPADDLRVTMAARIALEVYYIAFERWWAGDQTASRADVLDDVLRSLAPHDLIVPAPLG